MRGSLFLGHEYTFGVNFGNSEVALSRVSEFRYFVEHEKSTPLIWLLQNNDYYECTDASDRIYAYLGMQNEDRSVEPIEIDYTLSASALFITVTRKILIHQVHCGSVGLP
jgi:hypothetical protein